jgi:methanogenic corrinoid protein MtbC1
MMIAAQGFEMIDLGVDCAPAAFVSAVRDSGAELVCLSSLLPTTMGAFREIILALERAGLRDTVTVMVGGPLVTGEFAAGIGADAWAPDAVSAAEYCRLL